MVAAYQAKNGRFWYGTGEQSVEFSQRISTADLNPNLTMSTKNYSGKSNFDYIPIDISWMLNVDMNMYTDPDVKEAQLDMLEYWLFNDGDEQDAIMDYSGLGPDRNEFVGFKNIISNNVRFTGPFDDILALIGTIGAETSCRGILTPSTSLTHNTSPTTAQEAVIPTKGVRNIWILSEDGAGTASLTIETKRGAAAWATLQSGPSDNLVDEAVSATDRKKGSIYRVKFNDDQFMAADRVRVRFPDSTASGNTWKGKIAVGEISKFS